MKKEYEKNLNEEQKKVMIEKGTEPPGTGKLLYNKKKGVYKCAACGNVLFKSEHKFESGSGWPSFYDVAGKKSVKLKRDADGVRIEVACANCGAHLGHLFNDAFQTPTGKRYCMNSVALDFKEN